MLLKQVLFEIWHAKHWEKYLDLSTVKVNAMVNCGETMVNAHTELINTATQFKENALSVIEKIPNISNNKWHKSTWMIGSFGRFRALCNYQGQVHSLAKGLTHCNCE